MKDKIITLLQTIINKIRGLQMTAPIPQEEYAEYLEDVIGVVNDSDLDVPNELPDTTGASVGDVLGLDDNKNPAWITPASGGGVLVVHETDAIPTALDKTWKEIHDAMLSGGAVIVDLAGFVGIVNMVSSVSDPDEYNVYTNTDNGHYFTDTENGYPHIDEQH